MKSQMRIVRIVAIVALLTSVFTFSSFSTVTGENSKIEREKNRPELQVKFLGANGDFLYFELSMQQVDALRSNLRILNEDGHELYAETVFSKSTVRKIKVSKGEAEKIEFLYNTVKGEAKKVISIQIKIQEAIEVKEIN